MKWLTALLVWAIVAFVGVLLGALVAIVTEYRTPSTYATPAAVTWAKGVSRYWWRTYLVVQERRCRAIRGRRGQLAPEDEYNGPRCPNRVAFAPDEEQPGDVALCPRHRSWGLAVTP